MSARSPRLPPLPGVLSSSGHPPSRALPHLGNTEAQSSTDGDVLCTHLRSPSLLLRKTHSSPSSLPYRLPTGSFSRTHCRPCPTRPDPPVTRTTKRGK